MNSNFDVLITGAGPSGIACGIALQKLGIKCLIVDKSKFPREKLCGGLLTDKALKKILELINNNMNIVEKATMQVVNRVGMANNNVILNASDVDIPIRIIDRTILDNGMVEYYKSIGGAINENENYLNYDVKNKVVKTNKEEYKVKYFVKAIGASSKSNNKNIGFCLEAFINKDDVDLPEKDTIIIDFGIIDKGYAWIFPSGNYIKIGYGNLYDKCFNYKNRFVKYLEQLNVKNILNYNIRGAFVPYGRCEDNHNIDNFCILLGDQAGMTDPLYGEGLYFAYKTGAILANELKSSIDKNTIDYDAKVQFDKEQVNTGHILKTIFFNKIIQSIFSWVIKRKKKLIKFYVDEQVSEYKYKHSDFIGLVRGYKRYKYE